MALTGASGSGKSTLMNILGCLDRPTTGKYWLDGEEVSRFSADARALVRAAEGRVLAVNYTRRFAPAFQRLAGELGAIQHVSGVYVKGLKHKRITHHGEHYRLDNAPLPMGWVQKPHPPLWYGLRSGQSGSLLPARRGMNVVTLGNDERALGRHCRGRNSSEEAVELGHDGGAFVLVVPAHDVEHLLHRIAV